MNNKVTDFPQYRMLTNAKSFYKITSDRSFEEIQVVGRKLYKHLVYAEQYPEILKIQDMLNAYDNFYVPIDKEKWDEINQ